MTSTGPVRKFLAWLNAEEEGAEMESMDPNMPPPAPTETPKRQRERERGPLVLHGGTEGGMEIRHPHSLDERMTIGKDLRQRCTVALDLTKLPEADARYFLEFVYGVVFALDAMAVKVTEGIYLLAPHGVDVRNDTETEPISTLPTAPAFSAPSRAAAPVREKQEELFWQGQGR